MKNSSIVIGIVEGGWGFPCLILVLLLILKYKGPCLGYLIFILMGVIRASMVATTSCSMFPYEWIT